MTGQSKNFYSRAGNTILAWSSRPLTFAVLGAHVRCLSRMRPMNMHTYQLWQSLVVTGISMLFVELVPKVINDCGQFNLKKRRKKSVCVCVANMGHFSLVFDFVILE